MTASTQYRIGIHDSDRNPAQLAYFCAGNPASGPDRPGRKVGSHTGFGPVFSPAVLLPNNLMSITFSTGIPLSQPVFGPFKPVRHTDLHPGFGPVLVSGNCALACLSTSIRVRKPNFAFASERSRRRRRTALNSSQRCQRVAFSPHRLRGNPDLNCPPARLSSRPLQTPVL